MGEHAVDPAFDWAKSYADGDVTQRAFMTDRSLVRTLRSLDAGVRLYMYIGPGLPGNRKYDLGYLGITLPGITG